MTTLPIAFWDDVERIRTSAPLIHNITNYVVMNNTANALLALGASPVMAHAFEEVADMASIASALVVNIGTLSPDWVEAMEIAMRTAQSKRIPVVFDPVGAGATPYRDRVCQRLLQAASPTIIRGNGSEIMALETKGMRTKGVDSTEASADALASARKLSLQTGAVVVISGPTDYIVQGDQVLENSLGTPLMTRVTGLGCTASALCGAFAAINPSPLAAAHHAMTLMGLCGELALVKTQTPGSFQTAFIDALYSVRPQ